MGCRDVIAVLDVGASGGRLFLAARDDCVLSLKEIQRFAHTPVDLWQYDAETLQPHPHACWDVYGIWNHLLAGLRTIARRDDVRLVSFALDTWGSDGAWMTAEGDLLHPIATGRDARWIQAREQIHLQIGPEALFKRTGLQSHPFNVLNQLCWYVAHQPRLVDAASTYLPINGLFYYFLTGQRMAEYTWMSTTQLCPAGTCAYDRELFARFNLPLEKMPPLLSPGASLGECCAELAAHCGLDPFEILVSATHDTACAYAAAPVDEAKPAFIVSTGTWFLAGILVAEPILTHEAFLTGFANEAGMEGIRFLKNILGTWPLQELRRQWACQDGRELSWEALNELALSAPAFACIADLADERLFAPPDMEQALMAVCRDVGSVPSNRAQMIRTVYEALAWSVAHTQQVAQTLSGIVLQEILILGGCARNHLLCQWIADASGLPVRAAHPDATACGNALIQAHALGWIDSFSEGRRMFARSASQTLFEPHVHTGWERLTKTYDHVF